MDILTILYTIFIQPLQSVFELIFNIANKFTGHPGFSIIALSLIMNFLVLPLYKRADEMQEQQRDTEMKLKKGIDHINKSFTGDERMMILQTYYRQNNYKPTDALNGSVSLLLEIPFFIAAYQFLSHLSILNGISLGPIADLSQPDAMFMIGDFTVNVLPIMMTLINVVSSAIYLKGFPLKTKIQLYAMALFFLVFLYESPSGLVFYWTLNNLFSLVKNVFYKLKNPGKVLGYLLSICGLLIAGFGLFIYETKSMNQRVFLFSMGLILQLPMILSFVGKKIKLVKENEKVSYKNILLSGLLIAIFVGLYIPSSVISSSPEEFISITYFHDPIQYLIHTFCIALGFFVVWIGVFYWISNTSIKSLFEKVMWIIAGVFVVDYMFFGTNLGNLLPNLRYENGLTFTLNEKVMNLIVICFVILMMSLFIWKFKKHVASILAICLLAFTSISGLNIKNINDVVSVYHEKVDDIMSRRPHFNLSKTGKNVIVLVLDRALNYQIPYIFNEKPELKEQFAGFTHYTNTISFGAYTNFGMPSVFGGYEYTPIEMNKRDDESLVSKHNEALKVLPHLYSNNGFNVTMCDPAYANYEWIPDLSIYDEYENVNAYITEGIFNDKTSDIQDVNNNYRNFFYFSMMKSMPVFAQNTIYDKGNYHKLAGSVSKDEIVEYSVQNTISTTEATGINNKFMKGYNVLVNLDTMTHIQDDHTNNFFMMVNNATHEPMMLQAPDYVPSMNVNNKEYVESIKDKYTIGDQTLKMETETQVIHYHANMAAMIKLGNWFDYLRENGVYDNTKIIIASDHGRVINQIDDLKVGSDDDTTNAEYYNAVLLVKDFNSKEFNVSDEFMTNADVPTLALNGTIENPVNPFTGKPINNDYKFEEDLYIIRSKQWRTQVNNGNTFLPAKWALVKDNLWDKNNWTFIEEESVLPY